MITEFIQVQLIVDDHKESIDLVITNLGKTTLYLGYDWLKCHNLTIDWQDKTIYLDGCFKECTAYKLYTLSLELGDYLFMIDVEHYLYKTQIDDLPLPYTASPNWVHKFPDIFSKKGFEQLPSHHLWNYVIEFTIDFKPVNSPIYPLTLKE